MADVELSDLPLEAMLDVILCWRSANEAPGGISPLQAIQSMRASIFQMKNFLDELGIQTT